MKLQNKYTEGNDFPPLPPGEYYCTIEKCALKKSGDRSKNPGAPYYSVQLGQTSSKQKIFDILMIDEGYLSSHTFAQNKLISLIAASGFPAARNVGDELVIPQPDAFLAKQVYAQIGLQVDKNTGETKNCVNHYYAESEEVRKRAGKPVATRADHSASVASDKAAYNRAIEAQKKGDDECPF